MAIKGLPKAFEKSAKDKEVKGMKEGSRREEAFDRRQMTKPAAKQQVKRFAGRGG